MFPMRNVPKHFGVVEKCSLVDWCCTRRWVSFVHQGHSASVGKDSTTLRWNHIKRKSNASKETVAGLQIVSDHIFEPDLVTSVSDNCSAMKKEEMVVLADTVDHTRKANLSTEKTPAIYIRGKSSVTHEMNPRVQRWAQRTKDFQFSVSIKVYFANSQMHFKVSFIPLSNCIIKSQSIRHEKEETSFLARSENLELYRSYVTTSKTWFQVVNPKSL